MRSGGSRGSLLGSGEHYDFELTSISSSCLRPVAPCACTFCPLTPTALWHCRVACREREEVSDALAHGLVSLFGSVGLQRLRIERVSIQHTVYWC